MKRDIQRYLDDVPERRELRFLYDPEKQRILERFSEYESPEEKLLNEEARQAEAEFIKLNRFWTELDKERGIEFVEAPPLGIAIDRKQGELSADMEYRKRFSTAYGGQLLILLIEAEEGMNRKWNRYRCMLNSGAEKEYCSNK